MNIWLRIIFMNVFQDSFWSSERNTDTMSELYLNEDIDYSEENVKIKPSARPFWTIPVWAWTKKKRDNESYEKET